MAPKYKPNIRYVKYTKYIECIKYIKYRYIQPQTCIIWNLQKSLKYKCMEIWNLDTDLLFLCKMQLLKLENMIFEKL